MRSGLTLQGGFNYARTSLDACEINNALPEITAFGSPKHRHDQSVVRHHPQPAADDGPGHLHRAENRRAARVHAPQRRRRAPLSANYVASAAQTTLGRPFAGASQTITVNLIEPGTLYGDRVNQFDLRVAKNLRFGGTRMNVGVDVTNLLNSNPVLTYHEAFSTSTSAWLRPNSVLQPRLVKVGAQFNF